MNLRYVYIKDKGGVFSDGIELYCDRSWRFNTTTDGYVVCTKIAKGGEEKFTTSLLIDETPVENVNVVVGVNGSGKTSFAEILSRLSSTQADDITVVFSGHSVEDASKECWYSFSKIKGGELRSNTLVFKGVDEPPDCADLGYDFDINELYTFVYLTPHFTTEIPFVFCDDNFADLSTAGLLSPGSTPMFQTRLEMNGIVADLSKEEFSFDERRRVLELANEYFRIAEGEDVKAPFLLPKKVLVKAATLTIERLRKICEEKIKECEKGGDRRDNLERNRKLIDILDYTKRGCIFSNMYGLFVVLCACVRNPYEHTERDWNGVCRLINDWEEGMSLDAVLQSLSRAFPRNTKESDFFRLLWDMQNCVRQIEHGESDVLMLDLKENEKAVLGLIGAHKALHLETPLFHIEFSPRISSGEMAYLTMFGRAYSLITQGELPTGHKIKKDILFFLDEIETALHPEWQRQILWNWLWFFETFAKDRSVHLIFASHSPLLLSDIPVSHAIFLERQELKDSNKVETTTIVRSSGQVVKKSLDMRDTFFANIQDLYALPFVLKSGVVGKRAELLLREALNKKLKIEYVDRKKVVERIGDPIVRSVALETLRLGGYEDLNNEEK